MLADLLRENEAALLPLVRKAYDLGYREGMAAKPAPVAAPVPQPAPQPAAAPVAVLAAPSASLYAPEPEAEALEDQQEVIEEEDEDVDDGTRPVRASITVGGLVRKINRYYGLERFDIEVRVVDPKSHRHLMRDVRLSRYVVEK